MNDHKIRERDTEPVDSRRPTFRIIGAFLAIIVWSAASNWVSATNYEHYRDVFAEGGVFFTGFALGDITLTILAWSRRPRPMK